jgi:hypothetical protein
LRFLLTFFFLLFAVWVRAAAIAVVHAELSVPEGERRFAKSLASHVQRWYNEAGVEADLIADSTLSATAKYKVVVLVDLMVDLILVIFLETSLGVVSEIFLEAAEVVDEVVLNLDTMFRPELKLVLRKLLLAVKRMSTYGYMIHARNAVEMAPKRVHSLKLVPHVMEVASKEFNSKPCLERWQA